MPSKTSLPINKLFFISIIMFGILILQVHNLQAQIDYINFNFIGGECSTERYEAAIAEGQYNAALSKVHELDAHVLALKTRLLLGSNRKSKKHYDELEQAETDARLAKTEAKRLYNILDDKNAALMLCIRDLHCPRCYERTSIGHRQASCDTCDETNFFSCQHDCPGIQTCSNPNCDAKLKTDADKALHHEITCSGCNVPYYYCDESEAEYHRPRVCQIYDGYMHNGEPYHFYMGQLFAGWRHCYSLFRNCSNPAGSCTIIPNLTNSHDDNNAFSTSCPSCSGISFLVDACPLH